MVSKEYPFTATIRLAQGSFGSAEVTIDSYLIKNGILQVGKSYQFIVKKEDEDHAS